MSVKPKHHASLIGLIKQLIRASAIDQEARESGLTTGEVLFMLNGYTKEEAVSFLTAHGKRTSVSHPGEIWSTPYGRRAYQNASRNQRVEAGKELENLLGVSGDQRPEDSGAGSPLPAVREVA